MIAAVFLSAGIEIASVCSKLLTGPVLGFFFKYLTGDFVRKKKKQLSNKNKLNDSTLCTLKLSTTKKAYLQREREDTLLIQVLLSVGVIRATVSCPNIF